MQSIITGKDIVALHQLFVVVTLFKNHIMNLGNTGNLIKLLCDTSGSFLCEDNKLTKCNEYNCKRCKYDFV